MAQQTFIHPFGVRFYTLTPDDLAIWLAVSRRFRRDASPRRGYGAPADGSLLVSSRRDDRRDGRIMFRMARIDPAGLTATSVAHSLVANGWLAP
jgi:hypothetical protein